jgi:hypothetical protein
VKILLPTTAVEMAHHHLIPHHSRTAMNVVSHTESEFAELELSLQEFDEDIELEHCLLYLEHAMAREDEEQCEDAFMHLLDDDLLSTTAPVGVVVSDLDVLVDMEERNWSLVVDDVRSVSTSSSFDQYDVPLRDTDIVCSSGIYTKEDHPGNIRMKRIISHNVVKWGKATSKQQQDLIVDICAEIGRGSQNPKFLFTGLSIGEIIYCREASVNEVMKTISDELLLNFKIIPKEQDYIFGMGKPIYNWPGNVRYRDYMSKRIPKYKRQDSIGKEVIIKEVKKHVAHQGGRFLYPFDNANPSVGCIEVRDAGDIEEKLKRILRESKGGLSSRRCDPPSGSPSSETR